MRGENIGVAFTNESCTAPQKHVAVASSWLDQPSLEDPARGKKGLELSAVAAIVASLCKSVSCKVWDGGWIEEK